MQIWSGADSSILTEIGDVNAPNVARLLNRGYNYYETLWPLGGIAAGSIEAGINAEHLRLLVERQWAVAMLDDAKSPAAEANEWEESGQDDAFEADKTQHLVDAESFAKMLNKWSIQKGTGRRIRFMYKASRGNPLGQEGQLLLREATVLARLPDSMIQVPQTSCAGQPAAGVKTMKVERIRDLRVVKLPTASPSSQNGNSVTGGASLTT